MRELRPTWDGDQGPIMEFVLHDSGLPRNITTAAVEMKIEDGDGALLAARPCVIQTPKSDGKIRIHFRGSETDWDGAGAVIQLKPKIYYATASDGTPATNLLLNQSFDLATGTSPSRLPDSWTLVGAATATWDNHANESAPPSIFGTAQSVTHPTLSDPDYIQQVPAVSLAAGDTLSVGAWHRIHGSAGDAAGGIKNNTHAIFFHAGAQANTFTQFEIGTHDWYFARGSVVTPTAETACTMGLDARGTTSLNRYDEAFCFKGIWRVIHADAIRYQVKKRARVAKTGGNLIAGVGSFEADSDLDGFPDGWYKSDPTNTYSIEKSPTNVSHGAASLRVALGDATGRMIHTIKRGRYLAGETWRASVKAKTSGALGSGAGTGGFAIGVRSDYFDNSAIESASTALGTSLGTFTDHSAQVTLTEDHSLLIVEIKLNGKTGSIWIDDVRLTRV